MFPKKGFALTEWIFLILFFFMVSLIVYPLLKYSASSKERACAQKLLTLLQSGKQLATRTGCEVKIDYHNESEITLLQRQECKSKGFVKAGDAIQIPDTISLHSVLPLYIDSDGKIANGKHRLQSQFILPLNGKALIIDGLSGYVFEK